MKKNLLCWAILCVFIFLPKIIQASPSCITVGGVPVDVNDPACYTSVWVSDIKNCVWSKVGYSCAKLIGGAWQPVYTVMGGGSCPSNNWIKCPDGQASSWCHANVYANSCGGSYCTNEGSVPANFTQDNSHWDYTCHYTVPATWGLPAADGLRLAATVTQLSTPNATDCSNQSNSSYINSIPDLQINGSDIGITVNKANPINIDWSSTYATSCSVPATSSTVGGWTGNKGISGSETKDISSAPKPASSGAAPTVLNYQIACTNPGLVNVLDTVPVTVICTPDLNPAWNDCNKTCGDGIQTRTVRYANCYEQTTQQACNNGDCPVSSEWKEIRP